MSDPAARDGPALDVRLVPAALIGWLTSAVGILTPAGPALTALCALVAASAALARRRLPAPVVTAVLAARSPGGLPLLRRILRDVHAVQFPLSMLRMSTMTPRTIAAFHAAGVEVHAWTINDEPTMNRLLDLGVDGLVTDRADLAMGVLGARS